MKIKLQKLHVQRKMWKGHNTHASCSYVYCVNNRKDVERESPQLMSVYIVKIIL